MSVKRQSAVRRFTPLLAGLFAAVAFASASQAAGNDAAAPAAPASATKVVVTADTQVALKGGGRLVLRKDGTTYHEDAAGNRVRMRDGVTMEAVDGTRYVMKNDAVWRTITEKGTLHPTHQ